MNFIEVAFDSLRNRVNTILEVKYGKKNLGPASPLGQLLDIFLMGMQDQYLYLRNIIRELDFRRTSDARVINLVADIAGHIRRMAIPARGTLRMRVKAEFNLDDLPLSQITITNKALFRNNTNGLYYTIDLGGSQSRVLNIDRVSDLVLPIMQAVSTKNSFTSTGYTKQFYHIATSEDITPAEWGIQVFVNSTPWARRKSFVDLQPGETGFYVRPGQEEGFDIGFGNGNYGAVPPPGALIECFYLLTNGRLGNLLDFNINDWSYDGGITDNNGEEIDPIEIFDIYQETEITLGANAESLDFTKKIVPHVSTNFVLATEKQFEYYFSASGRFSYVKVWTDYYENLNTRSSKVYVTLIPNVQLLFGARYSYFNMPYSAFFIDEAEKKILLDEIYNTVITHINTQIVLVNPVIQRWVTFVQVRLFKNQTNSSQEIITEDQILKEIRNQIGLYYIQWERKDRLPVSDIIRIVEGVAGVDSCNVFFISENNEKYHREEVNSPNYNPNTIIDLDPVMGDALFDPNAIPIFRGGWFDRDGLYYRDEISSDGGLGSCNIIVTGYSVL